MRKFLPLILILLLLPLASAQLQGVPDTAGLQSTFQTVDTIFFVLLAIYIIIGVFKIVRVYRKEKTLPFIRFFKNKKALLAVIISLLGVVIFIVAMFQPWYTIKADVNTEQFKTNGLQDIIKIDGANGVTLNKDVFKGITVPPVSSFNLILLIIVLGSIFGLLGAKSLRSFGENYIKSGIKSLLPFFLIIGFAIMLPSIADTLTKNIPTIKDNFVLDAFVSDFTKSVASQPISGEYTKNLTVPIKADLKIQWGLEAGMWMFLFAGIIKIIGGSLAFAFSRKIDSQPFLLKKKGLRSQRK